MITLKRYQHHPRKFRGGQGSGWGSCLTPGAFQPSSCWRMVHGWVYTQLPYPTTSTILSRQPGPRSIQPHVLSNSSDTKRNTRPLWGSSSSSSNDCFCFEVTRQRVNPSTHSPERAAGRPERHEDGRVFYQGILSDPIDRAPLQYGAQASADGPALRRVQAARALLLMPCHRVTTNRSTTNQLLTTND